MKPNHRHISPFYSCRTLSSVLLFCSAWLGGICIPARAQQHQIDSIEQVIAETKSDTTRINSLYKLSGYVFMTNPDSSIALCENALQLSQAINYEFGLSEGYGTLGYLYKNNEDIPKALDYNLKSLRILRKTGRKKDEAVVLNNLGFLYDLLGDLNKALEYYYASLKIREEINDPEGIATSYNNLGAFHDEQNNIEKAIEYFEKSILYFEKIGDSAGISITLNNIGVVYSKSDSLLDKATPYYRRSYEISKQLKDLRAMAYSYYHFGNTFQRQNQLDSAEYYLLKSLKIRRNLSEIEGIADCMTTLSHTYRKKGELNKALLYADSALTMAKASHFSLNIMEAAKSLQKIYGELGQWKQAFEMTVLNHQMKDSLFSEETEKNTVKREIMYQHQKERILSEKEFEKERILTQGAKGRRTAILYVSIVVVVLIFVFSILIQRRLKITRLQKSILEEQKHVIDEHQEEIDASIVYAKKIQSALFNKLYGDIRNMPSNFILSKPKGIVSGDFHWVKEKGDFIYIAAVDCTGDGVPAAFLSMLGSAYLNEISAENDQINPATMLNLLKKKMIAALGKNISGSDIRDGMNITLTRIRISSMKTNQIEVDWAGANTPSFYVSDNQIHVFSPDKQPIGYQIKSVPFRNHSISLSKNDTIYLCTNGFWDQFGGPQQHRIGKKKFSEILLNLSKDKIDRQESVLNDIFEEWKGPNEQIDDVLIIGLKF